MFKINQAFTFNTEGIHVTYAQTSSGMWFLNESHEKSWHSIGLTKDVFKWHKEHAPLPTLDNLNLILTDQGLLDVQQAINTHFYQ